MIIMMRGKPMQCLGREKSTRIDSVWEVEKAVDL